ncbi:MAG: hypothetical protein L0Z50_21835, partial [Verrucomicrobiales bacterium]|nr:hypothetical protein [Verrucomicrobiales bacterium]
VDYTIRDGLAVSGQDYVPQGGTLVFTPGERLKSIFVPIVDDVLEEPNKDFDVVLSNASVGAVLDNQNTAKIWITNDDFVLQLSSPNYVVNEFSGFLNVQVTRQLQGDWMFGVPDAPIKIVTENGSAAVGRDFLAPVKQPQFEFILNQGQQTTVNVQIPILDNPTFDGTRTFMLKLTDPASGVVIGARSNAVVTILDDDTVLAPARGINGWVRMILPAADRKWLIGGWFSSVDGYPRNQIAKLNRDGTLDLTFDPGNGADGRIQAVALQPDEKLLIGGQFTNINGVARSRVARLNRDGSLDTTFDPGSGWTGLLNQFYPPSEVRAIAVQPDGRILIAGTGAEYDGIPILGIVRANADGTHDPSFAVGQRFFTGVTAIALQSDGKMVVAGSRRLVRLNANGAQDTQFVEMSWGAGFNAVPGNPSPIYEVLAMFVHPDGSIWLGGETAGSLFGLLHLSPEGSRMPEKWRMSGHVCTVALQPDGKVLVTGLLFDHAIGKSSTLIRFNPAGNLDATFSMGDVPAGNITPWRCNQMARSRLALNHGMSRSLSNFRPRNSVVSMRAEGL